ncbi:MAG: lytic murein transglycosylase [Qingshengfaniella sp.]
MRARSFLAVFATFVATCAASDLAASDARPDPRPGLVAVTRVASPRPVLRPQETAPAQVKMTQDNLGFSAWLGDFQTRARAAGISQATLTRTLPGLRYNTGVIGRDRNQGEFSRAIWDYLDSAVSETRIRNGRDALARHGAALDRIEAHYGVDKQIVAAIWGLESAYGTFRGNENTIEAMATLAYDGRRGAFFEEQLIAALRIIEAGDVVPAGMKGSWAGAMGHTQFMHTSYLAYAVDFDGDGRRDIWSDDPTDALASAAAYLAGFGWEKGAPWGVEVVLPEAFDYRLADGRRQSTEAWHALGIRSMSGAVLPDNDRAEILLPAGARGPALMIFPNFRVIERYNSADAYVIAIGHLADRLRGAPDFRADWPRGDRALRLAEREELQRALTRAGFSTKGVDGRIGPNTIGAIRSYQQATGLIPDGYASLDLLNRLR